MNAELRNKVDSLDRIVAIFTGLTVWHGIRGILDRINANALAA